MKSEQLDKLIGKLHVIINETRRKLRKHELNEEWTKQSLVLPLLEGLGWDPVFEIYPESHVNRNNGRIDYLLKPKEHKNSTLCIEVKSLLIPAPEDRAHNYIVKGLEKTVQKEASYFIWTNGDSWQIYALSIPNAPIYEIRLTATNGIEKNVKKLTEQFRILCKDEFFSNPKGIDTAILANWKVVALPVAFSKIMKELPDEITELFKKVLPEKLGFTSEDILKFLEQCKLKTQDNDPAIITRSRARKIIPCTEEWEKLVNSLEPRYQKAREKLIKNERRKLAEYLIGDNYNPWPNTITWHILGLSKRSSSTKTVTGPAVAIYRKWGFIESQNHMSKRDVIYQRVEEAMVYLKKLLES